MADSATIVSQMQSEYSSLPLEGLAVTGVFGVVAFVYVAMISYRIAHTGSLKGASIEKWKAL